MRKFVWRLQRVLDLKEKEEQIRTAELFALTEKLAQTRGELVMQQRILREMLEGIARRKGNDRLSQQELFCRYSGPTDEKIKQVKAVISNLETEQKQRIKELTEIRRFKESLERLRDEAKRRFIAEQERIEQRQLDEAATMSYTRKMLQPAAAEQNGEDEKTVARDIQEK